MKPRLGVAATILISLVAVRALSQDPARADRGDPGIAAVLEPIRIKYRLPALAGAIVTEDGLVAAGAVGVRKAGTGVAVMIDDLWHLGSNTKAMTAALIGVLVEQGKLDWTTSLEQVFPDLAADLPPEMRRLTLRHLLSHRAGLPANLPWYDLAKSGRSLREQRLETVKMLAKVKLLSEPGSTYLYSNLGYVVAGAMVERTVSAAWEETIKALIFEPLGMTGAGFGGVGTTGQIDQPWSHDAKGRPAPANGPAIDNPAVLGPAGTVHATLRDWAKFVADQIRGARGGEALLKPQTYMRLHTPPFRGEYALGWLRAEYDRTGTTLTHSGSNTMNYAVVWMRLPAAPRTADVAVDARSDARRIETPDGLRSPKAGFAVLVVTNQGGPSASKACDRAVTALIKLQK